MVKATPVLRELIGTGKTRNSDETLLYKAFPGGFLALAGAAALTTWLVARCVSFCRTGGQVPPSPAKETRSLWPRANCDIRFELAVSPSMLAYGPGRKPY